MTEYYVSYSLEKHTYEAGPYDSYDEAEIHRRDIASFAGVRECFITPHRNPIRPLTAFEAADLIPTDQEIYVLYMILGDGTEHIVELTSEEGIRSIPYTLPSESYWMLPRERD